MTEEKDYPFSDRSFASMMRRVPRSTRWICRLRGHDWRRTFLGVMCQRCDALPNAPKGKSG